MIRNIKIDDWYASIGYNYNLFSGTSTTKEISVIVKASVETTFHRWMSPITRPFVREVFWFKQAYPELTKLCPEIGSISPGKSTLVNDQHLRINILLTGDWFRSADKLSIHSLTSWGLHISQTFFNIHPPYET